MKIEKHKLLFFSLIFTPSLLFPGCFGLFDSSSDRVSGKYKILWIDLPENQALVKEFELHSSSSSEIIEPYVFAVGHNKDFIIAKQHPTNGFEGGYNIDTKITNYYIVDINRKRLTHGDNKYGPLSKKQFDSLRSELDIQDIQFDKVYPDKP